MIPCVPRTWSRLADRVVHGRQPVAGVLSGTSADGIDVALMRFSAAARQASPAGSPEPGPPELGPPELLHFETRPFDEPLAGRLRSALDGELLGPGAVARLDRDLGRAFGRALRAVAAAAGLQPVLAGSHGQTLWHHDGCEAQAPGGGPATLQLGCGDELAEQAGCAVAFDFRRRDVAAGGEGAPLSPLVDAVLFERLPRPGAVLNLGGIANLTLLDATGCVAAFDTGPAGSLLDGLARRLLGRPRDEDGARARSGRVHAALVETLARHPFLERGPPKSTGRDTFGQPYVERVLATARALGVERDEDVLASAVDFVALHAARGLALVPGFRTDAPVAVAGGGLHNRALREALERRCEGPVASAADHGVDPDAREALVFGVLGARCLLGIPSTDPRATGAAAGRVLGRLCHPPSQREPEPGEPETERAARPAVRDLAGGPA